MAIWILRKERKLMATRNELPHTEIHYSASCGNITTWRRLRGSWINALNIERHPGALSSGSPFFDSYPVFHEEIVNVLMEQLNMSKKAPLPIVASHWIFSVISSLLMKNLPSRCFILSHAHQDDCCYREFSWWRQARFPLPPAWGNPDWNLLRLKWESNHEK